MRTHSVIISSTNFLPLFWRIYWNSSEHSFILIFLKNDYSWIWWILHLRLWIGEYLNFLLGTFATNCYIQKKIIKKIALVQVQKITTFGHELLATQLDNKIPQSSFYGHCRGDGVRKGCRELSTCASLFHASMSAP